MTAPFDLSLYLVAGRPAVGARGLEDTIRQAVAGGVTMVQIRDPRAATRDLVEETYALKKLLAPLNVALIVNDRVDVVLAAGADGVHLGQDDMTPSDARRLLGPDLIIGLSVGNPGEFEASRDHLHAVDYLGVGPVRATSTKSNAGDSIGVEGLAAIRALTELPIVGIGGLGAGSVAPVIRAGAQGVAVVSAICGAGDAAEAARGLIAEIRSAR
jgi:thiamine-phosphate pyrophosphorylase